MVTPNNLWPMVPKSGPQGPLSCMSNAGNRGKNQPTQLKNSVRRSHNETGPKTTDRTILHVGPHHRFITELSVVTTSNIQHNFTFFLRAKEDKSALIIFILIPVEIYFTVICWFSCYQVMTSINVIGSLVEFSYFLHKSVLKS